jgi:glycosyltransferase involved in cell wall biosynthesis
MVVIVTGSSLSSYQQYLLQLVQAHFPAAILEYHGMADALFFAGKVRKRQPTVVLDMAGTGKQFSVPTIAVREELPNAKTTSRLTHAVVPFRFLAAQLAAQGLATERITVVPPAAGQAFAPLSWEAKQEVKDSLSKGLEYFLLLAPDATEETLTQLLKAFSTFKKWQHSSMQLVLYTRNNTFLAKLDNYKYREDVVVQETPGADTWPKYLAAAYGALLFTADTAIPILQAMQCGTPVITTVHPFLPEMAGADVLQVEAVTAGQVSQRMMMLYKNEALHRQIGLNLLELAKNYPQEQALAALKQLIG